MPQDDLLHDFQGRVFMLMLSAGYDPQCFRAPSLDRARVIISFSPGMMAEPSAELNIIQQLILTQLSPEHVPELTQLPDGSPALLVTDATLVPIADFETAVKAVLDQHGIPEAHFQTRGGLNTHRACVASGYRLCWSSSDFGVLQVRYSEQRVRLRRTGTRASLRAEFFAGAEIALRTVYGNLVSRSGNPVDVVSVLRVG